MQANILSILLSVFLIAHIYTWLLLLVIISTYMYTQFVVIVLINSKYMHSWW